jgi:hypothetical protein
VIRFLVRSPWVKRVSHGVPVARLLLLAEVALLAGHHLTCLDSAERSRLFSLLRRTRGRPGLLTTAERRELLILFARLEPRLFLGTAVRQLSPMPMPKRLLYGRRGSPARAALARKN